MKPEPLLDPARVLQRLHVKGKPWVILLAMLTNAALERRSPPDATGDESPQVVKALRVAGFKVPDRFVPGYPWDGRRMERVAMIYVQSKDGTLRHWVLLYFGRVYCPSFGIDPEYLKEPDLLVVSHLPILGHPSSPLYERFKSSRFAAPAWLQRAKGVSVSGGNENTSGRPGSPRVSA